MDVEPLGKFQEDWRPDEPRRLDPVYVERTSLRDALAARRGLSPQNILGYVELIEPTFQVGFVLCLLPHPVLLARTRHESI